MSAKRRVYEVARDLGLDNKSLLGVLETLGVQDVKNHMSVLSTDDEDRIKKHLGKASAPSEDGEAASLARVVPGRVVRRRRTDDGVTEEAAVGTGRAASSPTTSSGPLTPDMAAASASGALASGSPTVVRRTVVRRPTESAPSAPAASDQPVMAPAVAEEEQAAQAPSSTTVPRAAASSAAHAPAPSGAAAPAAAAAAARSSASDEAPVSEARALAPEAPRTPSAPTPVEAPLPTGLPAGGGPSNGSAAPSPAAAAASQAVTAPKRGVEVWEGRPGVPMQHHRPGQRRVQYDAKAPAPGGPRGSRPGGGPPGRSMPPGRPGGPGGKSRGIGSFSKGRLGAPVTKERAAHKKVVRIEETVNLQTLAGNMGVKSTDVLRKLLTLGMTGININSTLDADTAKIVASEFGWEVEDVAVSEEEQLQKAQGFDTDPDSEEDLDPRPPVVTVMGHVDHGKTSLLDALRATNVVSGEAGGITQHIGAYSVETERGKITFLDTPGHAAFTQMRARGAQATDLVVLVVAADDGVMPQTKEAIQHAQSAGVPIVVAINKIDKPESQPERVRRELSDQGLVPEEWGGETLFCEVSAHTKAGLPDLLDKLLLQAEMLDLRANPDKPGSGLVIEAQLDRGRGPLATVLVQEGTLRPGDVVLAGAGFGKVRAMQDWAGRMLKSAGPSDPVAIIGLSDVPRAGDQVYVVKDLKTAQEIADTRRVRERRSLAPSAGNKPRSLEEIAKLMAEADQLELKVIVKADVAGSAEAVSESLLQLSTEKVKVSIVLQAAGAITENDVNLAVAAGAIIVGFNSKPAGKAAAVAQREGIQIRQYSIIYNVLDDVRMAMEGLLAPKLVEKALGKAEIRQLFRISKSGTVAGSMIIDGMVKRGVGARLERDGEVIWEGRIVGLKRFKDDVREVKEGFECGISLEATAEPQVGDIIHVFDTEEVKQSL